MNDNLKLVSNNYLPLRDVVFQTLEQAILLGDLKPGERLMEIQLANRLGVSRTPIREAIHKLELEGLVVLVPRKGAQVASITAKDLNDVLEVRCGLEELAVELACLRITPEELAALKKTCAEFKAAVYARDIAGIAVKDIDFHDIICKASHNDRLVQMLGNIRQQMYRYRVEYIKDITSHKNLIDEHEALVRFIENKDIENAKKEMKAHITNQVNAIKKTIKKQ